MPWVTFIGWKRYAHQRSIERANAQRRSDAGMGPRKPGPSSDEWAAFQERLQQQGG